MSVDGLIRYYLNGAWHTRRRKHRILKPYSSAKGYLVVALSKKGKVKNFYVHQLVAAAFIGKRPKGHQVAHWNGNKKDNRVLNIRYATPKQNAADRKRHGTHLTGEKVNSAKLSSLQVKWVRTNARKMSAVKMSRRLNVSRTTIGLILHNKTWRHVR